MRAGICSIQQALSVEALAIVKQALSLARRRGHAQVTPLHVATSMLASSTGLLRQACLQSHSHPLQCKALDLCLNVALNRLPASSSSPLLFPPHPSLSNALVAAFKRAQAHQRRGSIENQQQPILAIKIEIEQLVISILDDPSVSRVMREAGFSSTHIKSRVEQAVSFADTSSAHQHQHHTTALSPHTKGFTDAKPLSVVHLAHSSLEHATTSSINQDVASVLDVLLGRATRRMNPVIVGEGLSGPEAVVRGVINKFESGDVPLELRSVQLVSLPLFSLRNSSREEVDQKLVDLRSLVSSSIGRGIVFYLGDMQAISEFWSTCLDHHNYTSNLDYLVLELKKMVSGFKESNRIWLMGVATFRTYMKCKVGYPSLEAIWNLHPLTVPAGSLSFSLNLDSDLPVDSKSNVSIHVETRRECCKERCTITSSKDVQEISRPEIKETSGNSTLPLWLQKYKNDNSIGSPHPKSETPTAFHQEECVSDKNLCRKWNSFCYRAHQDSLPGKMLKFYSTPSSPTASLSSPERNSSFPQSHHSWSTMIESKLSPKEHQFWTSDGEAMADPPKPDLMSNPNSSPNSASSSEVAENMNASNPSFKEFSTENIKILSDALVAKVPWQGKIIPKIVDTILNCRSGSGIKSEGSRAGYQRMETSMMFLGSDSHAKETIARELAKLVFGSRGNFISIVLSRFSGSVQDQGNKRPREESGFSFLQMLGEAVNENPHRVFFLEDVDQFDYSSKFGIRRAIESGIISVSGGEVVSLQDAIIIFSCDSLNPVSGREKKSLDQQEKESEDTRSSDLEEKKLISLSLDLNMAMEHEDDEEVNGIRMLMDCIDGKIIFKSSVQ